MRNTLMANWMQDVDDMFRTFTPAAVGKNKNEGLWFTPAVDVNETDTQYEFYFDLPGMSEKDLQIDIRGRELHVTGERKLETKEGGRHHRAERFFGQFERTFVLPRDVNPEKIEAQFKDGVLQIQVPKSETAQAKTIPIRTH